MTVVPTMDNRISTGNVIVGILALISPMATFAGAAFWFGGQSQEIASHEVRLSESAAIVAQINERVRALEINTGRADERMLLILESLRKIEARIDAGKLP